MAEIQQYDQRTHVLERPSMYIGPVDKSDRTVWVLDESQDHGQTGHFVFICTDEDCG
jgi:DNA gyrase/topoisomerase IV subunit B